MGKCAVCGGNFISGAILGMAGLPTGIQSFELGGIEQTMYAHSPVCTKRVKDFCDEVAKIDDLEKEDADIKPRLPFVINYYLPDGPLRDILNQEDEG